MSRLSLPAAAAAALITLTLQALSLPAQAETLACQSINGRTVCIQGSGNLSCQTVNNQTICMEGSGSVSCRTVNGRTVCTTDRDKKPGKSARPAEPPAPMPFDLKTGLGGDVSVEQYGNSLHVRSGGIDVRIE